jgi:hypothetical protein
MDTLTASTEFEPTAAESIARFEGMIVEHKQFNEARAAIAALRTRSQTTWKKRPKARALLVMGFSGSGKSTILEKYCDDMEAETIMGGVDGDVRPIVYLEMPAKPTRKQVVAAILATLGVPASADWNTDFIITRISELFRKLKVEMVLIDEAHHINSAKSAHVEEEVSEFLKSLLNRSGAQFVLFGLPSLMTLAAHLQLKRRLQPPIFLTPYRWDLKEDQFQFRGVVRHLENAMAPLEPFGLFKVENAVRLYCATGGHVGLVSKYLSEAFRRALAGNLKTVDLKLLAQVHADFENPGTSIEMSDDWAAPPTDKREGLDPAMNPFLADNDQFSKLWKAMKEVRKEMSKAATQRSSRRTGLTGIGYTPSAFR